MRILIVCPAGPGTRHGNRVSALRWSRILRGLGMRVAIAARFTDQKTDLLLALHARKSADSVERFRRRYPDRPVVVALTGTDVYRDVHRSARARRSLELATRLVALQPLAARELTLRLRRRVRVIYQSVPRIRRRVRSGRSFPVCVIGHLRPEKDPFRAALAARRLPADSRIRIRHLGGPRSPALAARARREEARNRRYRWLGERPRSAALRLLAGSRILVHSSRLEGGANVISEALAAETPVLASRIPGNVGLLGARYPGLFPAGDTAALTRLLRRAETDPRFLGRLSRAIRSRTAIVSPVREREAWRALLEEILPAFRG